MNSERHSYGNRLTRNTDDGIPYRQCVKCGVRKRTVERILSNGRGPRAKIHVTQYAGKPYIGWSVERPKCHAKPEHPGPAGRGQR